MKRNPLILFFLLFFNCFVFAQDQNNSHFYFKSVSAGIGIIGGDETSGGLVLNADVTTALNKNLFSLAFSSGAEVQILDGDTYRHCYELNILYGREFKIATFFKIEAHAGVGIFSEKYRNDTTDFQKKSQSAVGIPVRLKLLFYITPKFAMGLNPNVNFNSIENVYSGNLIFQYNFGKR